MATYYVSPDGTPSAPYNSWDTAAALPETIAALNPAGGPHTVYIAPGTYTSYMLFTSTNWAGSTIIATSAHGETTPATIDQVIINITGGQYGCRITCNNMTLGYFTISGGDATHANIILSGTGNIFNHICSRNAAYYCVYASGGSNTFNYSTFKGSSAGSNSRADSAATLTFNYCEIRNNGSLVGGTSWALLNSSSGAVYLNNCLIFGSGKYAVVNTGAGSTTIKNSILSSGWEMNYATIVINAGAVHVFNSILIGNWWSNAIVSGTVGVLATDSNNIKTQIPLFTKRAAPAFLGLSFDDTGNLDYVESIETILAARGLKATFYAHANAMTGDTLTRINALIARGTISIGGHTWSHSYLTLTTAYSVTKAGATIDVDRATDTITITGDGGGTVTEFKTKTLAEIATALVALGCTIGTYPTGLSETVFGECLADSSGAQASPYTLSLLIDTTAATGYFKAEIADCKTWMEANLTGYTGKSFASPGGLTSANAETAVKAAGWLSMRNAGVGGLPGDCEWRLNSYDVYQGMTFGTDGIQAATNEEFRSQARQICEMLSTHGGFITLLSHNTTQFSAAEWEMLLDLLEDEYPDIIVSDVDTIIDTIRTGGLWATADDRTYTRAWTDGDDDFHIINRDSPCLDAGIDIGLTSDFEGNTVPWGMGVDIGLYESTVPKLDFFFVS